MEIIGWVVATIMFLLAASATISAITIGGRRAIPFGVFAFAFLSGAVVLGIMTKMSSPSGDSAESVGKDFYRVEWEEETPKGTTMVVVSDESGEFYFSEFDSPLGVPKILAVEKERFKPLLLPEKTK